MSTAADRVEKFLDVRKTMLGVHPEFIYGVGDLTGQYALTDEDLRILVAKAKLFDMVQPLTSNAVENDYESVKNL